MGMVAVPWVTTTRMLGMIRVILTGTQNQSLMTMKGTMMRLRRYSFILLIFLFGMGGSAFSQISYYYDRAMGLNPLTGDLNPISRGQVRVCISSASGSPCSPVASIFDTAGNPLTVVGGNFGQLTTDNVGNFNFGCTSGNYMIQVAASNSNSPQLNYLTTCGGSGGGGGGG